MKMKTRLNSHDEDAASGALAQIFWQDNDALALFLNLIGVDNTQLESNWKISAQYPTKTGRSMDIFLRNGSTSIVVEAKIGDVIKAFQFDSYARHVIEHETGKMPRLVWLVQHPRSVVGDLAKKARMITWHDIYNLLCKSAKSETQQFAQDLLSLRIAVPPHEKKVTCKGYLPEHAVGILRGVRDGFDEIDGDVEENTRTPLSLHVGRSSWNLYWRKRVWFYLQPLTQQPNQIAPFGFVCHIILFNSEHDQFSSARIEQWSRILATMGLSLWRNESGKWHKGYRIEGPLRLSFKTGVKWIFAEQKTSTQSDFDWTNPREAIAAGREYLAWGLSVVDRCISETTCL